MITVTKAQIIEAIRTEPLKPGRWIDLYRTDDAPKDCPVCAVGAILRRAGVDPYEIQNVAEDITDACPANEGDFRPICFSREDGDGTPSDVLEEASALAEEERPWNALSVLFEGLTSLQDAEGEARLTMPEVRASLETFVSEAFPEELEIPYEAC